MTSTADPRALAERFTEFAKRDDCLNHMTPSDLRMIVGALTAALDENAKLLARAEKAEAQRDHNAEVIDLNNLMLTRTEARIAEARNAALREALEHLRLVGPHLVDGPEHDVGAHHGYHEALRNLERLIDAETAPQPALSGTSEPQAAPEVTMQQAAQVLLKAKYVDIRPAFDAIDRSANENAYRIFAAALLVLAGEDQT